MKNIEELSKELNQQIEELKRYDKQLDEVTGLLLKEVKNRFNKKPNNMNSGVMPYKANKYNPEFLDSVASLAKARLDSKKALIKAYNDQMNLLSRLKIDQEDELTYKQLAKAFKTAMKEGD